MELWSCRRNSTVVSQSQLFLFSVWRMWGSKDHDFCSTEECRLPTMLFSVLPHITWLLLWPLHVCVSQPAFNLWRSSIRTLEPVCSPAMVSLLVPHGHRTVPSTEEPSEPGTRSLHLHQWKQTQVQRFHSFVRYRCSSRSTLQRPILTSSVCVFGCGSVCVGGWGGRGRGIPQLCTFLRGQKVKLCFLRSHTGLSSFTAPREWT